MPDQIANTVGALLVGTDGKVLLGLRAPWKPTWPSYWDTIGGRVETGESLDAALVREVEEQVGVVPAEFSLIASVAERRPDLYGAALHHIYAVTAWNGGEPTNASNEHTEIRWFTIDEMHRLTNIVDSDYVRLSQLIINPGSSA